MDLSSRDVKLALQHCTSRALLCGNVAARRGGSGGMGDRVWGEVWGVGENILAKKTPVRGKFLLLLLLFFFLNGVCAP